MQHRNRISNYRNVYCKLSNKNADKTTTRIIQDTLKKVEEMKRNMLCSREKKREDQWYYTKK